MVISDMSFMTLNFVSISAVFALEAMSRQPMRFQYSKGTMLFLALIPK